MIQIKKYFPYLIKSELYFFGIRLKFEITDHAHPFFTVEENGSVIYTGSSHQECQNYCEDNGIALEER